MSEFLSLYKTLQISKSASQEDIKIAFRKLSLIHHPDKSGNTPENNAEFIRIHNAYKVLIDPEKRNEYDSFLKTSNVIKKYSQKGSNSSLLLQGGSLCSLDKIFNHLNAQIWDIEDFLAPAYESFLKQKSADLSIGQYILKILTFMDRWILYPSGYRDYFMEARKLKDINIMDYVYLIGSGRRGHTPFVNIRDYFYDIRKRMDRFLNKTTLSDLFKNVPGYEIRIIDSVFESQNYGIHYLSYLNRFLENEKILIEPFIHSDSCFES